MSTEVIQEAKDWLDIRFKGVFRRVIERDGLDCHWCHKTCDPKLRASADLFPTADHLKKREHGGVRTMENIVVACRKCNNTRHRHDHLWVGK